VALKEEHMATTRYTRRDFIGAVSLGAASLAVVQDASAVQQQAGSHLKLPNIIFIMADDMGYGDTTVYNPESKIPTPHLEQLASEGVTFTDAHSRGRNVHGRPFTRRLVHPVAVWPAHRTLPLA
jgi:hypothetical protein